MISISLLTHPKPIQIRTLNIIFKTTTFGSGGSIPISHTMNESAYGLILYSHATQLFQHTERERERAMSFLISLDLYPKEEEKTIETKRRNYERNRRDIK